MPTYGYRCESCGHEFEEFQSIKADPIKVCPECKRPKVRRLIGTGSAVLFKGSGFYETDYRSKTYMQSAKADTSSSSSSTSSGSDTASAGANGSSSGKAASTNVSTNGSSNGKTASTNVSTNGSTGTKDSAGKNGSGK